MSEEILKALMQLFAIISKQDDGVSESHRDFVQKFLLSQVNPDIADEYLALFEKHLEGKKSKNPEKKKKLTSVTDSVRTLAICKKINKTLTIKQKVVVLIRLYEMLNHQKQFTPQRIQIISTVSEVFNIDKNEAKLIENFILNEEPYSLESPDIMVIDNQPIVTLDYVNGIHHMQSQGLEGCVTIMRVKSVELYFLKYLGSTDIYMDGLNIDTSKIYLFTTGSTIRLPQGPLYFSNVISRFRKDENSLDLTFKADTISHWFGESNQALHDVSLAEEAGSLVAIMGASGAGKTTLLNILSGIDTPTQGKVTINGIDLHNEREKLEGVIGYIPQDDLLIEELTVFQNLYLNAKLCFKDLSHAELTKKVSSLLFMLGLNEAKHNKVGSVMNKNISGGQRKRLNIALELIREPSVLFVDEPTSGLSSRDSENVMDLLKEISLKGKIIFVVIHQPSSDIFKLFDRLFLLDTGGYPIYYGNPVEASIYFKKATNRINSESGECTLCGNVNPEMIFNIVEERAVDDFGQYLDERKIYPKQWNNRFKEKIPEREVKETNEIPPQTFDSPNKINQWLVFLKRDVLAKISNKQYLLINLLEAPVLAFILAFIVRYSDNAGGYMFSENENIPAYIFMSIIVMMFIGLTLSAEEIFKDLKILKREQFLNLSRFSYLTSKVAILMGISLIQSFLFVLVGNSVIGLEGMFWQYWFMLFSVALFSNLLGLNISSSFNSVVTIYIIIPLLIIPQMILGGAMFSFDKINRTLGGGYDVPVIAQVMTSKWAYEGLMVNQYVNNKFKKQFYEIDKKISKYDFITAYWIPEIERIFSEVQYNELQGKNVQQETLLLNEVNKMIDILNIEIEEATFISHVDPALFEIQEVSSEKLNHYSRYKDKLISEFVSTREGEEKFFHIKNKYTNKSLTDIVRKSLVSDKVVIEDDEIIQVIDPVYRAEDSNNSLFKAAPFFIAQKSIFGTNISTYWFNVLIIMFFSVMLFVTLYFDVLKRLLNINLSKIKHLFPFK